MIGLIKGTMRNLKSVPGLPAPIASFKTNVGGYPLEVVSSVEAVQSGSGNPYPPGGGSNKWDEVWENGIINNTGEDVTSITPRIRSKNYISCSPNTSYYFYFGSTNYNIRLCFYDSNKSFISVVNDSWNAVYTTPATCYYMRFCVSGADISTYNNNISINYPSSVTTYSPYENICPISGWNGCVVTRTGANVWDEEWEVGAISTTNGQNVSSSTTIRSKNYIPCIPSTPYYRKSPQNIIPFFYDNNKGFISFSGWGKNNGITTPNNAYYIRFYVDPAYGTTYNNDISINYPSTDTAYHAYNGNTYTIAFGATYYGGEVDVTSGVLRVTKGMVDLSDLTWVSGGSSVFAAVLSGLVVRTSGLSPLVCECYQTGNVSNITPTGDSIIWQYYNTSNIRVKDTRYSTLADFSDNVSGKLVYELATPFTVQLSPQQIEQLRGENNVFVDCGNIDSVKYSNRQIYYGR